MGSRWVRRGAGAIIVAAALVAAGCSGVGGEVEPLEGMEPLLMREMASEAYSMWDPASVQLVALDLVRGRRIDAARYDLDIRYTLRKVNEPTATTHAALAARAAASPEPEIAAQAPKLRQLAQTALGDTAEFTETITLVPHAGTWLPKAWRDGEQARRAAEARRAAPAR